MLKLNNRPSAPKGAGFTLIEILLTLAIVAILAGLSLPIYFQLKPKNDLDTVALYVVSSLRRAQTLAMSGEHDYSWGVTLETSNVTLYAIDTNGNRVTEYDETDAVPDTITYTGLTTITFKKLTGEPTTAGSIFLTNPNNDVQKTITINQSGLVSF